MTTDVLIIGSGIAGLTVAAKIAERNPQTNIIILTKGTALDSNTNLAQGGIAVVSDITSDSFPKHIGDTLRAGDGLNDQAVVEMVVMEGPERLSELVKWGISFDRASDGNLALGIEGGHTSRRVVHFKDVTGNHVAQGLLTYLSKLQNVKILSNYFALDLIVEPNVVGSETACEGVFVLDVLAKEVKTLSAKVTVLATGGIGQVYRTTTNPLVATGDGIAMAYRAGAKVRDMEFIQFHPTALHSENDNPSFLISEAVRGHGAFLVNGTGERFILRYDQRGEMASRDVVSKAIHLELTKSQEQSVFLDCRHLDQSDLKRLFPTIYLHCLAEGVDPSCHRIPVSPAAHYLCGGIEVDTNGQSSIARLYACGECSRTGLHGANRLASNSLLEALVYAHKIFLSVEKLLQQRTDFRQKQFRCLTATAANEEWIADQREMVRNIMNQSAGIVRNDCDLATGLSAMEGLANHVQNIYGNTFPTVSLCELRNMILVGSLILKSSLSRRENRGAYYNHDLA